MKNMYAVGASASSSKKDAGLRGTEVLTAIEIQPSENGGFSVTERFKLEPPKGSRDHYPGYVEPKVYTFETYETMAAHVKKCLGK